MSSQQGPGALGVVVLALIFGVIGGGVGGYLFARGEYGPADPPTVIQQPPPGDDGLPPARVEVRTDKDAIVNAVASVSPAVVKITGLREPRNWMELVMSGGVVRGIGSGVVFEYEGRKLVLTNTHVISDFTDLTLKFVDGRELKAKPLGRLPAEDLAVLEILDPPPDLTAAPLGDSEKVRPGEWVIAVGNPFDFEHTVTVGVVSAAGMREFGDRSRKVIQTDAAINAGNSGGPLVDLAGNIVGINHMIYSPGGAPGAVAVNVGIGFAIPINQAKELMYFLVHRGPFLGVANVMPNSTAFARYFDLSTAEGMVVMGVYQGSPAQEAGLRVRDVILAVEGDEVSNTEELQKAIFRHKIGDTIRLTVERAGRRMEIDVVAGKAPDDIYF